ncbi:Protein SUPPRESSOR OF FRI 4 [Durusdinium trenchii]|uniref:Protein SUPPRESSOR OF FRI 4 n=1 Tax=Durusdinium trenchii TaxID=1381693 RepID=A0ABP0QZ39_9DINO
MGKKKLLGANQAPELGEVPPFCYYCDREFEDIKTLVHHQRAKHFCCNESGRTFDSVTSLRIHLLNSYKKSLKEVPNALPGRDNPDVVVHGMDGLPQDVLEERLQKLKAEAPEDLVRLDRGKEEAGREGDAKPAPSSPPAKSSTPATIDASPELPNAQPQQQQQAAASPDPTGTAGRAEPPLLEEDVEALADLPPALKLLVPELHSEALEPASERVPDAIASLHVLAVKALAAFGLLHPDAYEASKVDAALQAAIYTVKNPKSAQGLPAGTTDVPNPAQTGLPGMALPVGFMQAPTMVAAPQPRMGPPQMGCFPAAQFAPLQGAPMAAMPQNLGPGRPPAAVPTAAQGYVPSAQNMACGGCAQPRPLAFGVPVQPMLGTLPPMRGPTTMPIAGMTMQLPGGGLVMEPPEKRAKLDA